MAAIGSMLGIGGLGGSGPGAQGLNYQPTAASLLPVVNQNQIDTTYANQQQALAQQQDFVNALHGQNGLQNQSSVFNQMQGVANGTGPNPAQAMLNNSTGQNVANQAALMAGQRGTGSNPALMARQIANQGANIQQNAAGQGAALQAQQSLGALGQMGGMANQQVGQLQQGQNALLQGAQAGFGNVANAGNAMNNTRTAMQSNINNVGGSLAGHGATQQGNVMGGMMGAIGSAANMIPGLFKGGSNPAGGASGGLSPIGDIGGEGQWAGGGGAPTGEGGGKSMPMEAHGGLISKPYADGGAVDNSIQASGPQSNVGKMFKTTAKNMQAPMEQQATQEGYSAQAPMQKGSQDMLSGFGSLLPMVGGAAMNIIGGLGNQVKNSGIWENVEKAGQDMGGSISDLGENIGKGAEGIGQGVGEALPEIGKGVENIDQEGQDALGDVFHGGSKPDSTGEPKPDDGTIQAARGGPVRALVSPGERYLNPSEVEKVAKGKKDPMKAGEKIPGKAKVKGAKNSYANDTIPKTLEEGGLVLPRSVTQSKHPHWEAHKFISAIMAKNGGRLG